MMASDQPGDKPPSTEEQIVEALHGIRKVLEETNKGIADLTRAAEALKPALKKLEDGLRARPGA